MNKIESLFLSTTHEAWTLILFLYQSWFRNIFIDDNHDQEGTQLVLKGIDKQSDIGLLSLFEHYKSIKVGNNLKNPKFPIWVICSESHFTVLFRYLF